MKQSVEVEYCKNLFYITSQKKVREIIDDSNLNERERTLLYARYLKGLSVKEICNELQIEEEAYKKNHKKILTKLYNFIKNPQ